MSYRRHAHKGGWRAVGIEFGITGGMAHRIAHGYEPVKPKIRLQLGLPAYRVIQECPKCRTIHLMKYCPKKRVYKDLFDMPIYILKWKLENREIY